MSPDLLDSLDSPDSPDSLDSLDSLDALVEPDCAEVAAQGLGLEICT